ncbi:MAG: acyl carrier protein [Treponema sp.]|uniref:Phosphopantetheine attachment site n=2 Tax=Treponema berlinense TaxID=225004 RepID=A0A1T4PC00_9SPIR|nr:acyl carrier protein [Treponema berlinense]MDD5835468.1 acyl carrier protein [Treponema berlinense]MEE0351799.1 acyl carrier protein [Treponema sp.]SJZ88867.1 Phosphopantetheine attachment site [Treponema berlinense]
MEKLMNILTELKPDVDFETEKGLIDNAILDSFDIVQLIGQLQDTFDIEISPAEILPENFNSAEALWSMIQKLQ